MDMQCECSASIISNPLPRVGRDNSSRKCRLQGENDDWRKGSHRVPAEHSITWGGMKWKMLNLGFESQGSLPSGITPTSKFMR